MLIGFTGIAQSGKTTAANICLNYFSNKYTTEICSFAQPIKEGLERMGVTKTQYYEEYRHLAQYIGTDVLRAKYPDWWVVQAEKHIEKSNKQLIIFDDIRFPNELEFIKKNNGIVIYIYSGDRINLNQKVYQHESEKMCVDIHHAISENSLYALEGLLIRNDQNMQEFKNELEKLFHMIDQ